MSAPATVPTGCDHRLCRIATVSCIVSASPDWGFGMRRAAWVLVAAMLVAACGDDDDGGGGEGAATTTTVDAVTTTTAAPTTGIVTEGVVASVFSTQFTTVADGDGWRPNADDGMVTRVDGETGDIVAEIPVGDPDVPGANPDPQSLTTDPSGQVWATVNSTEAAVRIDPAMNEVVESVPVGFPPYGIAVTDTDIWVTGFEEHLVVRLDRATGQEVARLTDQTSPTAIVAAHGSIWVANHRSGNVVRIDPATNAVVGTVATAGSLEGMAASADAVWVAGNSARKVVRIDAATLETVDVPFEINVYGVSVGPDGVWAAMGPQDGCDDENSFIVLIDAAQQEELGRAAVDCAFDVTALPSGLVLAGSDGEPSGFTLLRWRGS